MSNTIAKTDSHKITYKVLHDRIPRYGLAEHNGGFVSMSPDVYQEFVSTVKRFPDLPAGSGGIKHEEGGSSVKVSYSGVNQRITASFMRGRNTETKIELNKDQVEDLKRVL